MSNNEIRKTIVIDAAPQVVFRALTDEEELTQWFPNQGAVLDARPGGALEFRFLRPDGEKHAFKGKILEIIPDKKLSYSWNAVGPNSDNGVITWTLEPADGGKTRVTLVHTGLKESKKDVEAGWSYEAGWTYFISQLAEHCKKEEAVESNEIRKTIMIEAQPEAVFRAISDEKELAKWFPDHARLELKIGGVVQLVFYKDGDVHAEDHQVEGRVLEMVPNKKLSYSWANTSDPKFPKTIVAWTLEPAGKGKTRVTLVHTGFDPKSRWFELHNQGWSYFVEDRLAKYCRGETLGKRGKIQ